VARRGGPVHLPVPTHSRYYPRTPDKLDPGVLKWVSMAEALGWGMADRPMTTITGGAKGMTDRWASGGNSVRNMIDAKVGGPDWVEPAEGVLAGRVVDKRQIHDVRLDVPEIAALQTYPAEGVGVRGAGWGFTNRPSPTVMGGAHGASGIELWDRMHRTAALDLIETGGFIPNGRTVNPDTPLDPIRMTPGEAATLQSYPPGTDDLVFTQNNKQANQARRTLDQPAPTVTAGHDSSNRGFIDPEGNLTQATPEQVAALQSYPEPPFVWCGSKSKKFLQIGNAVPPVLGEAVLAALLGIRPGR
jgi:DNA (cytosine-5)-methyltransferase 1